MVILIIIIAYTHSFHFSFIEIEVLIISLRLRILNKNGHIVGTVLWMWFVPTFRFEKLAGMIYIYIYIYYKVRIVCLFVFLSVCPQFTIEQLKLDPQTHIYLESVSPGEFHGKFIWPHTFLYKKKAKKWNFYQKKE